MKTQITRKKINLPKLFFINYVRSSVQQLIAIFYVVKIKSRKNILGSSMCRVTFGVKYISRTINDRTARPRYAGKYVLSGLTKTALDVLSRVAEMACMGFFWVENLCRIICPEWPKMVLDVLSYRMFCAAHLHFSALRSLQPI